MFSIHTDIRQAATLPTDFYKSAEVFEAVKEKIFATSWLYAADKTVVAEPQQVYPFSFLEGVLDEPLVFTNDKSGTVRCLSNVCTHRGKIVVEQAGRRNMLSCPYHGRCFQLDGTFRSMPAFEGVANFPTSADNLPQVPFAEWLGLLFVALQPLVPFEEVVRPIVERIGWLPLDTLHFDPTTSKDYFVEANWALYCDNYLEGLHVPFVHPGLNSALVLQDYTYELFPYCNLQLGVAKAGEPCFDIPKGAADEGRRIYAYYYWVFPNLMFNFYPWGLSLNVVTPLNHRQTKVSFRSYVYQNTPFNINDSRIDATEMEDEWVVESVQKGIQSRFYKTGRFSPTQELAVHHFHRLVAAFLKQG